METGKIIDLDESFKPSKMLVNRMTDRLYFVNSAGTVQCLRAIGRDTPTIREATDTEDAEAMEEAEKPEEKAPMDPGTNPFGAVPADPFGGAPADPFGAGGDAADPFGAPAGGADDPFGGNPFGN
jgi:hypothetical protein